MSHLKLVLNFGEFFTEDLGFSHAGVNLLLQNLRSSLENLNILRFTLITYSVTFVVLNYALRTNIYVVVLAKVLSLLVRVFGAELLLGMFLVLFFLFLSGHMLL